MNRKEFKSALFSYCEELGYIIYENTVNFEPFVCLFYMPDIQNYDDNTIHYVPISHTSLKKIKIQYNDSTLEFFKHIAKKWCILSKKQKIEKKFEKIKKDFE